MDRHLTGFVGIHREHLDGHDPIPAGGVAQDRDPVAIAHKTTAATVEFRRSNRAHPIDDQ